MAKEAKLTEIADAELLTKLAEAKEESFKLRFQNATGQLENSSLPKKTRKTIARIETEIRAREIRAAEAIAVPQGDS